MSIAIVQGLAFSGSAERRRCRGQCRLMAIASPRASQNMICVHWRTTESADQQGLLRQLYGLKHSTQSNVGADQCLLLMTGCCPAGL